MTKRIRILYTIPNFDTAGSGQHLLTLINNLDSDYFEAQIACLHDKGVLFQEIQNSNIKPTGV